MAYSESLAERLDEMLALRKGFDRRKMFGGVGYLLYGNMCVGVWKDYLIVRLGAEPAEKALKRKGVKPFDITGRAMTGWAMVEEGRLNGAKALSGWVESAIDFVETLPRK